MGYQNEIFKKRTGKKYKTCSSFNDLKNFGIDISFDLSDLVDDFKNKNLNEEEFLFALDYVKLSHTKFLKKLNKALNKKVK